MSLYDKSLATYDEGDAFDQLRRSVHRDLGLPLRSRRLATGGREAPRRGLTPDDPLLDTLPTTAGSPSQPASAGTVGTPA
jgi:hypothetical protein